LSCELQQPTCHYTNLVQHRVLMKSNRLFLELQDGLDWLLVKAFKVEILRFISTRITNMLFLRQPPRLIS
jgi:hypothetical protein